MTQKLLIGKKRFVDSNNIACGQFALLLFENRAVILNLPVPTLASRKVSNFD